MDSILSRLVHLAKGNSYGSGTALNYAEKEGVFPLLHLSEITNDQFSVGKNQKSVEFVANYLDYWWFNQETMPDSLLFYTILEEFMKRLNIENENETDISVRSNLNSIIIYFEKSGVYDEQFFKKIWKDSPAGMGHLPKGIRD